MTGLEIEIKMRITDPAAVAVTLDRAGAQLVGTRLEVNTFFDTPELSLRRSDRGLRTRVERVEDRPDPVVTITHKGPRSPGQVKSRPETELRVADDRAAADFLAALGFLPMLSFEKRRQSWRLDGCTVELDRLPHLGDFVEIEGPSPEAVLTLREKLGLADLPLINDSYASMLTKALREKGVTGSVIRFDSAGS